MPQSFLTFFFFFNDTAPTEIYTLPLHDALPIWTGLRAAAARPHVNHVLLEVLARVSERRLRAPRGSGDGVLEPRDRRVRQCRGAACALRRELRRSEHRGADRRRHHFLDPAQRDAVSRQLRPGARLPTPVPVLRRALGVPGLGARLT